MGKRARAGVLIVCVALVGAAGACSLFVSLDGLDDGPVSSDGGVDENSADVLQPGDATGDAAQADAGDGGEAGPCSGKPGAAMVAVAVYCIDSTEVTNKQYAEFLDAIAHGASLMQPAECSWNISALPTCKYDPVLRANYPVGCVDWCDAYAYCQWAGKRLCGHPDGGARDFNDPLTALNSQSYKACSANGTQVYPYGQTYLPGACNTMDVSDAGVPVASLPECVGGFPGIYDLGGNVEEWTDSCTLRFEGGKNDGCHESGDSFAYTQSGFARCDNDDSDRRDSLSAGIGFRCCSP